MKDQRDKSEERCIAVDNESLIAYTAGLMDGEGCIQINSCTGKSGKKYWHLTVQLSSNCDDVLRFLRNTWGIGSITEWQSKKSPNRRRSYNWRIYSAEAEFLLSALLPYLRIKHEQAVLGLEFRKFVSERFAALDDRARAERARIAQEMRILNRMYGKSVAMSPLHLVQ